MTSIALLRSRVLILAVKWQTLRKLGISSERRATSLSPRAQLVDDLNRRLDLPHDVRFVSIVVRGFGVGVGGEGKSYNHLVDHSFLDGLPIDFRKGGDQIVHVRSQNLALAGCSRRYEEATKTPIHSVLVRVPSPHLTRHDLHALEKVHEVVPQNPIVQEWVAMLLSLDDRFWKGMEKKGTGFLGHVPGKAMRVWDH